MKFTEKLSLEDVNGILETVPSGTNFSAVVRQHDKTNRLEGKLHIDQRSGRLWFCYNDGESGDESPNKHGYKRSWVIRDNNRDNIIELTLEVEPKEIPVVNKYEIY